MFQYFVQMDEYFLFLIQKYTQNSFFDSIMPGITFLGDKGLIWIVLILALLANKKYREAGILAFCVLFLSTIIGEGILKHLVHRPRPFVSIPNITLLVSAPRTYSFPSGHTISSFAVAGVLSQIYFSNTYSFFKVISFGPLPI